MRRSIRVPAALLACLALQGCYVHTAVRPVEAPAGAAVRVRVSAAEAERLAEVLGREQRVFHGTLVGEEPGGLLVEVPGAGGAQGLAQRVVLAPAQIVELELRRLDRPRTLGLTAALALVGGWVLWSQFGSDAREGPGTDRPPGNEARLPLGWHW